MSRWRICYVERREFARCPRLCEIPRRLSFWRFDYGYASGIAQDWPLSRPWLFSAQRVYAWASTAARAQRASCDVLCRLLDRLRACDIPPVISRCCTNYTHTFSRRGTLYALRILAAASFGDSTCIFALTAISSAAKNVWDADDLRAFACAHIPNIC